MKKIRCFTVSELAYAIINPASTNSWQMEYIKKHPGLFEEKEALMGPFAKRLPGIEIVRGELIERDFNFDGIGEVVVTGKPDFLIKKRSGHKMVAQVKMYSSKNRYQQRLAGEVQMLLYMGLSGVSTGRLLLYSRETEKVTNDIYVYFDQERFRASLLLGTSICLNPAFSENLRLGAMKKILYREK